MSRTATYHTTVEWTGEHWGHIQMGNGPQLPFSAPPDAHGHADVLTPEDAFVAAVNSCIMLMFLWAVERFKLDLRSYTCHAEGTKRIDLDRTETFTQVRLTPHIVIHRGDEDATAVEARARRALQAARKYSLVANSVTSEIIVEPIIEIVGGTPDTGEANVIHIKVLGSGCENCHKVEAIARQAVADLGLEATVEHVTDKAGIAAYRILATPGLVINERVVSAGRIPSPAEVTTWLGQVAQPA